MQQHVSNACRLTVSSNGERVRGGGRVEGSGGLKEEYSVNKQGYLILG